jgi:hypothetical protein
VIGNPSVSLEVQEVIMTLKLCIWLAIAMVITLRSLAVYSHHFIGDKQPLGLRERVLSWFRFYKRGFSITLGLVAFFLATVAFLDGSVPWTLGNLVFGFAAFIDFQKHRDLSVFKRLRAFFQSKMGSRLLYWFIPVTLLVGLLAYQVFSKEAWRGVNGTPFSYTGAYLLAIIFLAMKLEVWGALSHEAWPYLAGVLAWDALLLTGASLDANPPFIMLEGYALLLDSFTIYLVKLASSLPTRQLGASKESQ